MSNDGLKDIPLLNYEYISCGSTVVQKPVQKLVSMQNPDEVNKLLSDGYIFLSTVNTTDATFALLEKRN